MPPLQVKDCPTDVYERLRQCAQEENRSISQQALTIIEDYLSMRDNGAFLPRSNHGLASLPQPPQERVAYGEKRRRALERINSYSAIPITDELPSSAELIRQIRDEEAR